MKKAYLVFLLLISVLSSEAQILKPEYIQPGVSFKEFVEWAKSVDQWRPENAPIDISSVADSVVLDYRISDYKVVDNVYTGTNYIYLFKNDILFRTQVAPYSFKDFNERLLINHELIKEEDVDISDREMKEKYKEHTSEKKYTYYNKDFGYNTVVIVTSYDNGYEIEKSYKMYCEPIN